MTIVNRRVLEDQRAQQTVSQRRLRRHRAILARLSPSVFRSLLVGFCRRHGVKSPERQKVDPHPVLRHAGRPHHHGDPERAGSGHPRFLLASRPTSLAVALIAVGARPSAHLRLGIVGGSGGRRRFIIVPRPFLVVGRLHLRWRMAWRSPVHHDINTWTHYAVGNNKILATTSQNLHPQPVCRVRAGSAQLPEAADYQGGQPAPAIGSASRRIPTCSASRCGRADPRFNLSGLRLW